MKPSFFFVALFLMMGHAYAQECQCTDSKPAFTFTPKPGKTLLVCGKKDSAVNDRHKIVTDVMAISCTTGETFLGETEGEKFDVVMKPDKVIITSLRYLPVGKHFAWETTPYIEQDILLIKDTFAISEEQWKMEPASITKEEMKNVRTDFKAHVKDYAKLNSAYDNKKLIGKLLVSALNGDKESETLLENIQDKIGKVYEGDLADFYEEAQNILDFYKASHHLADPEDDD